MNNKDYFKKLINKNKTNSQYDCIVMFSGGKDSTYLAHKLKNFGYNVLLFSIEHGFDYIHRTQETVKSLGLDHYIFRPKESNYLFNFIFTNIDELKNINFLSGKLISNPVCFFCTSFMNSIATKFADEHNIPFVFRGTSPKQTKWKGNSLESIHKFEDFRESSKRYVYNQLKSLTNKNDTQIKIIIDKICYIPKLTTSKIIPFLYLDYNINKIISTIKKEYNWKNPLSIRNNLYWSSGCKIVELIKFFGIELEEYKEIELDYKQRKITKNVYNFDIRRRHINKKEVSRLLKELKLKNKDII